MTVAEELLRQPELSPFIGETAVQWAWDSTSLGWFKTCPRLYQYSMIEGWRPKTESVHLRFGIEFHQALHDYDVFRTQGASHEAALRNVIANLAISTNDWNPNPQESKAAKFKNRDFLFRTVIDYLDKFPSEEDPAKVYVLADGTPACEVSFRFELDMGPQPDVEDISYQPYVLCGHLDKIVTFQDELFVMDHKTTTTTPGDYYFNQFEPNNQMTLYTLAGQIVMSAPIKGVIIDAVQIAVGFTRSVRSLTYRTQDQINEWMRDLEKWLIKAEACADEGYWPQNDTACDKYGGCTFREICSKSPNVRPAFLKAHFTQEEPWNPLIPRDSE